ncbi:uncharacterized protein LOC123702660 [Colias croceus]|uniref:uncharacterized protein LOC123702660 n=1 Tax=Colias crocea TaxID=72248 RepID=UPI001E27C616|nr:uncharacterized protein LOC123702660 [Colias croceus]
MVRLFALSVFSIYLLTFVFADDDLTETSAQPEELTVENVIQQIEHLAALAEKSRREGILSTDHTEQLFDKIASSFNDLIELINAKNYTDTFFTLQGIDRVIIPNIRTTYTALRLQLIYLLKTLFKNAPSTANTFIPMNIIDMLLDVFENDDNLALKAHALDVMYQWLPNNPKLQARVMKLKGLEPFYEQIAKLDSNVVQKLLDLFNIILEEHLRARNEKQSKPNEMFKFYQMIGLVERMSTPTVCYGLLNIFKDTTTFSGNSREIFVPVAKLLKNIQPFCLNLYKGKNTAIDIFQNLHDFFKESVEKELFKDVQFNVTDIDLILTEYNEKVKEHYKDEF